MTTIPPPERHRLTWADLPGHQVGIYGLGVEGHANLAACRARGIEPVIVDDDPGSAVDEYRVLRTGQGGLDALLRCEIVIKSPGISRYGDTVRSLDASGVTVVGGLGLWLTGADLTRVLLVTGTKGKSTTTAIAAHLLRGFGYRVMLGGNIGSPPFDPAVGSDFDYWVVEVSSYQATDLPVTPPVTVVTSLDPDHLPWHAGDIAVYYRDKLSATSQPGAAVTVANGDSPALRAHAALLGGRVEWVALAADDGGRATAIDAAWTEQLGLLGAHNRRNALLARRALVAMGVAEASDDDALTTAARGFTGLPHRLQVVGRRNEVIFIDDGLSTNVLPVLAAVDAFPDRRVALLVGGQSRGIDYAPLALGLLPRAATCLVVTMPTNGPAIHAQLSAADRDGALSVVDAAGLEEATRMAADWARPDGVVLLSPAAPSFDLYRDYQAKGAAFRSAIESCGGSVFDAPSGAT